jgi:oxygen-independent coproporphyrinogen-3 oxidase
VLTTLQHHIGWAPQPEISIEIDPGTFDRAKIQAYRDLGVNRFSLGVQGFDSTLLHQCGRAHDLEDTYQALGLIQELKLKNWSLDLIAGLPSQTLETWHNSLTEAIRIGPPHLSIYDLTLEPTTVFGKRYQPGESPLPDDQTTAHMYRQSQQRLTQVGYEHYEVSNYAKPGHQCQHNRAYWCNQAYYGFGMGATSYVQGRRFSRPRTTQAYYGWVTSLGQGDWLRDLPETSGFDRLLDTLMLGSRLGEGLSLTELEQAFGSEVVAQVLVAVQPYQACGWVEIDRSGDDRLGNLQGNLRLNDPEGFLFSNTILASLFHHLEINYL